MGRTYEELQEENRELRDELEGIMLGAQGEMAERELLTALVKRMRRGKSHEWFMRQMNAELLKISRKYDEWDFESVLDTMSRKFGFRCHEWDDFNNSQMKVY